MLFLPRFHQSNTTQDEKPIDSPTAPSPQLHCSDNETANIISSVYSATRMSLVIPLSTFVIYLGHRRWRQRRSFATTSHSDIFTYHMIVVELIYLLGAVLYFCGVGVGSSVLIAVGAYVYSLVYPGQVFFQVLTCVERYLAVAQPVTYLWLRQSGGVRIRNISIGCSWLFCFSWLGVTASYMPQMPYIPFFCFTTLSLAVVSYCSLCVLRVLIRPGPGDVGGNRVQVAQSKKRAFYTIAAVTGTLWLWFIGFLIGLALDRSMLLDYTVGCLVLTSANWLTLPVSLILPLLFLHRAGKLSCSLCTNR